MTREEAIKYIKSRYIGSASERDGTKWSDAMWTAIEALSADRPTGKWVEQESDHIEKIYLCSSCNNYEAWGNTEKTPYCPQCGARMDGAESEDV